MPSSPADPPTLSPRTWLSGLVLAAACTAPPRPQPAAEATPAPPPPTVHVTVAAPGLTAADVEQQVVAPIERTLAPLPGVEALVSRADDGVAEVTATLATPAAFEAVYEAMKVGQTHLPHDTDLPVIHRGNHQPPVFALTLLDDPVSVPASVESLQRIAGVARVDVCGGASEAISIDLDPSRLAGRATDDVVRLVRLFAFDARDSTLPTFEELPDLALGLPADGAPPLRLRDIAVVRRRATPRPCKNLLDPGQAALLVVPQAEAAPQRVLADLLESFRSPTRDPAPSPLPPDAVLPPALLDLELADAAQAPKAVAACLRALPAVTGVTLVQPDPGPDAPVYARLLVSARPAPAPPPTDAKAPPPPPTFPIGPVREALSSCSGVRRAAVVAPLARSDHPLTVEVLGPEHAPLAAVADAAAARLRELPAVTLARVHAPREAPQQQIRLDREALAARGLAVAALADLLRLAVAPIDLGHALDRAPVLLDMPDRTGPLDQQLARLTVAATGGPVPLTALARVEAGPPVARPRYRADGRRAALVELRLRRAADRSAVEDALAALELPPGLQLRLGPALPLRAP